MRSKLLMGVAVALCVASGDVRAQQQVQLYASVADVTGKPVATLEPADLKVLEGGVEAKIVKVEPVSWPVKVQLLVDNGIGLGGQNIQSLKDGIKGLIEALPENLEVTIVTTAPQPRFLVRPTMDKAMMIEGLSRLAPDGGAGRFVESMNEATQRIEKDKTDHFPVIISSATSSGDANVLERDVKRIFERIQKTPDDRPRHSAEFDNGISDRRRQSDTGWSGGNAGDPRTVREHRRPDPARHAASGARQAGRSKPREAEPSVQDHG